MASIETDGTAMTLIDVPLYSAQRTLLVKLHRDASPSKGELVGRLEHLTEGDRRFFRNAQELVEAIMSVAATVDEKLFGDGSAP